MNIKHANLQYFVFSFLSLLALRYAASADLIPNQILPALCTTQDQPNPIAHLYPGNATGTLNGTVSVIPISLELARQLIPPQYGILEHAYRALLPTFPMGMYPAIVQALHDHDVQASGFKVDDFSRAGIEFPFLDRINDNSTSFKWTPAMLMTAGNAIALAGAQAYGIHTFPANFEPGCEAYRAVPNSKQCGTTEFNAQSIEAGAASLTTLFSPTETEVFPLDFFKNITNQPMFADDKTCDQMIRLFNTSVTTAPNTIQPIQGTVRANIFPFSSEQEWKDGYGLRLDTSFIENNYLPCENFRGYSGHE